MLTMRYGIGGAVLRYPKHDALVKRRVRIMAIYFGYSQTTNAYAAHRTEKILSGGVGCASDRADKVHSFPAFLSSLGVTLVSSYT